jgi:hypothetical protein
MSKLLFLLYQVALFLFTYHVQSSSIHEEKWSRGRWNAQNTEEFQKKAENKGSTAKKVMKHTTFGLRECIVIIHWAISQGD